MGIITVSLNSQLELIVTKNEDGDSNIWMEFTGDWRVGVFLFSGCCQSYGIRTTEIRNKPLCVEEP